MRMTELQLAEGQRCPWWARPWRRNLAAAYFDLLPIPICWAARAAWAFYCWTFWFRPTMLEKKCRIAHELGFQEGHILGFNNGFERAAAGKLIRFRSKEAAERN